MRNRKKILAKLEELKVQRALGTAGSVDVHGGQLCPTERIPLDASERRVPVKGRVHEMLRSCIEDYKGILPRVEIKGTQWTSSHIAFVEVTNLMKRTNGFHNRAYYRVTPVGERAYKLLNKAMLRGEKTVKIPIEINGARYLYHLNKHW